MELVIADHVPCYVIRQYSAHHSTYSISICASTIVLSHASSLILLNCLSFSVVKVTLTLPVPPSFKRDGSSEYMGRGSWKRRIRTPSLLVGTA